ncbi:MAG: DUF721 domain-containing protein [Verrucomicrobiota bacterium]|nr:DUF721 domain-containing protein [Verrucomicrobiota bacterium]
MKSIRRTPRNYDGIENPSKQLSDLLGEGLKAIREKAGQSSEEIFSAWPQIIGEQMAPLTEAVSFDDGILTVKVKSSTLYSLLSQHERPRLLKRLQEKFSIRGLKFRVG